MTALIVGGTSGLGLALARLLLATHEQVIITGRNNPQEPKIQYKQLILGPDNNFLLPIDRIVGTHDFDTVVYNPGFYQEGHINELSDKDILNMTNVGFLAAALLMQRIMKKQDALSCFIAITSTSQWIPREFEPVYTAVKAGLGMFANSLSLDPRIKKTCVVAPSGMKTQFWEGTDRDTSSMLDPQWVAQQIITLCADTFKYRYAHILRGPTRIEIVETR